MKLLTVKNSEYIQMGDTDAKIYICNKLLAQNQNAHNLFSEFYSPSKIFNNVEHQMLFELFKSKLVSV